MKKLVFCILFIFLLLGSFVIPCFAAIPDDYQISFTQYAPYNFRNYSKSNLTTTFLDDGSVVILSSSVLPFPYSYGFWASNDLIPGHYYCFTCRFSTDVSQYLALGFRDNNSLLFSSSKEYYYSIQKQYQSRPEVGLTQQGGSANMSGTLYFLNIFDLTEIYGSGNEPSDFSVFQSDMLSYGIDVYSKLDQGSFNVHKVGFFTPLTDFYLSFFHLFDWFPEIISTYSAPFVFCVICLSVFLIVFIIVSIIRRCRNS